MLRRWRSTACGYSDPIMHGPLQFERLTRDRRAARVGRRIVLRDEVASTNDEAWRFLDQPDGDGTTVFAEYQSHGRGRLGRRWESPRGASVMCSVLLIDETPGLVAGLPHGQTGLPMAPEARNTPSSHHGAANGVIGLLAAIACRDAILAATRLPCEIQWPNDVVVQGRKLAGVLIEMRSIDQGGSAYVVGVGINCLQHAKHFDPSLGERATSLDLECPQSIDRHQVARSLLDELDRWFGYDRPSDAGAVREAWIQRAAPLGRRLRLRHRGAEFVGQMIDVDPLAHLVVQLDEGGRRLFSADDTTVVSYGDR